MGVVYRAIDTKLGREVAIKVLPESFAAHPDRMSRFAREAQVLASLNHPNIAAIYGIEERALIMELVEGPTLAELMWPASGHPGPIPLKEALLIARQISEGLEAAHEKGIVHRDLKPANVKLTGGTVSGREWRVKLLDFGLAKAVVDDTPFSDSADSPTMTLSATAAGMLLGTAAYMSPEQARGTHIDKRSDVWAFGALLFEMLTGKQCFPGDHVADILASALKSEPQWDALPSDTPPAIRRLLARCLEKDRRRRLADIAEAHFEIEEVLAGTSRASMSYVPLPAPPRPRRKLWFAGAAVGGLAVVAAAVWLWNGSHRTLNPLVRFDIEFDGGSINNPLHTIAPDGSRVVFVARDTDGKARLHSRALNEAKATPLSGTEHAREPFFSPDGQWLAFFAEGAIRKVPARGGAAVKICDAADVRGASWGEDNFIVFTPDNRSALFRVSADGGAPQPLTELNNGEITHRNPQVLPGSGDVLFTANGTPNDFENAAIQMRFRKSGEIRTVLRGGYFARYVADDFLTWMHQGGLYAAAFDRKRGELKGQPVLLLEDLSPEASRGVGHFAVSPSGLFVGLTGAGFSRRSLAWQKAGAESEPLPLGPGFYFSPRLAPEGKRVALEVIEGAKRDIFVYDSERNRLAPLTFTGDAEGPIWTPDGKHIVYVASGRGQHALCWIRSDGGSQPEILLRRTDSMVVATPDSFTPDGKTLVFSANGGRTRRDIWALPLDLTDPDHPKAGIARPLIQSVLSERDAAISPDGRWLAYTATELTPGTRPEVFVQHFPPMGGRWKISNGGGMHPTWSARGLLFITPDGGISISTYGVDGSLFMPNPPETWAKAMTRATNSERAYDVTADGKRAIVLRVEQEKGRSSPRLMFLLNFSDELRRRIGR